jgi:uncharacterized damage-inducible protein DinB
MRIGFAAAALLLLASTAQAQEKASANPATTGIQNIYALARDFILKSAEQVPEDKYSFRATKDVRSFGQILGHVADAQNLFCGLAAGKDAKYADTTEKTVTTKAGLIAALKASSAACDAAYRSTTDAGLTKTVALFGRPATISQILTLNAAHDYEHYGNLVTYMRLMGMVPPSSQGG